MADLLNLARQQTLTTGPGTLTLGPVVTGFISWAAAGAVDGQEYSYGIEQGNQREQGRGVYNATTQELTRNVLKSTNNDEPLDLDGTAQVVCTPAAEDFLSTALEITVTPVGNLASTNVQNALEELDTEKEAAGTAASAVADHEAAADPHPQYLTDAEGDAAYESSGAVATHEASGIHTAIRYNGAYVLPLNTDLDTITEAGFYLVQSPVNSPEGLAGYFYVDMQRHPTLAEYRLQTAHQMSTSSSPRWYRQRFGSTWGAWQKVLTGTHEAATDPHPQYLREDDVDQVATEDVKYTAAKHLAAGADLNTLLQGGMYTASSVVNGPADAGTDFIYLEVIPYTSNTYVLQIASRLSTTTSTRWVRKCLNGTWLPWVRLWTDDVAAAHGLGEVDAPLPPGDDLNNVVTTGIVTFNSSTLNSPGNWGNVLTMRRGVARRAQLAIINNVAGTVYARYYADTWSSWTTLYTQRNILGNVFQSGGVPTGAIIERGSNSNGEYIKFADGTMICRSAGLSTPSTDEATGSIYRSATMPTWTFPASFMAGQGPIVSGQTASLNMWVCANDPYTTHVLFRTMYARSLATAINVYLTAIGRWF